MSKITIPKTETHEVNHITEKEMFEKFSNIHSCVCDEYGITKVIINKD